MNKTRATTFDDLVAELEKDAEFRKADQQIKPYYDLLAEIIRRRRELNITQEELAARTEMRQSSIARLEAGEHNARLSTLIKIAEALEAKLEIRLVPVYYVEDDDYTRLLKVSASTSTGDDVSKPSLQVGCGNPIRTWEAVNA